MIEFAGYQAQLEFFGRTDDQIKINGIRIEPGEIEAILLELPCVSAAVVKLHEKPSSAPRLIAHLVPSPATIPNTENVRATLERQLPPNMVPSYFIWLDAMPMTPNGKLDRRALLWRQCSRTFLFLTTTHRKLNLSTKSPGSGKTCCRPRQPASVRIFLTLEGILLRFSLFATIESRFGHRLSVDVLSVED